MSVVLDSWAVIKYLEGVEPAATSLDELLKQDRPLISWINLGEVFYVVRRKHGEAQAFAVVRDLQLVTESELPTEDRILEAARIKADHAMAFADAFAAATAIARNATVWTGDPELLIEGSRWKWRDLR